MDLFKIVAKERGTSKTILETAPRSDSKANGEAENAVQTIEQMVRTYMIDLQERVENICPWMTRSTHGSWSMRVT